MVMGNKETKKQEKIKEDKDLTIADQIMLSLTAIVVLIEMFIFAFEYVTSETTTEAQPEEQKSIDTSGKLDYSQT
jgi:hypothetical protein